LKAWTSTENGDYYTIFTSACVSIADAPSPAGAASADAVSSVCMGSSGEPAEMDEIDWRETKEQTKISHKVKKTTF